MRNEQPPLNPDQIRDDQRVTAVDYLYNLAKNSQERRDAERRWDEADLLYDGDHWNSKLAGEGSLANWQAKIAINYTQSRVTKAVSILMMNRAEMQVLPDNPFTADLADVLNELLYYAWDKQGWTTTFAEVFKKALIRRVHFVKTYWDKHAAFGRGLPAVEPVSAKELYLHPHSRIKCGRLVTPGLVHLMPMTRDEIISKYDVDPQPLDRREPPRTYSPQGAPVKGQSQSAAQKEVTTSGIAGLPQTYEVKEAWIQDQSRVETPEIDDLGTPVTALRYPFGRMIVTCNDKVLRDMDARELGFRFCPYVPFCEDPDSERLYGPSLVNQLKGPQLELNKRRSQITDHAAYTAKPPFTVDPASGMSIREVEALINDPNAMRPGRGFPDLTGGGAINFLQMPRLDPAVITSVQLCINDIDDLSAMHQAARGETPASVRAASAIEALQSEAHAVMFLRSMYFEDPMRQAVLNVLSLCLDLMADERKIRVASAGGGYDYKTINVVEQLAQIQQEAGLSRDEIEFDIKLQAGTRAMSQRMQSQLALTLHQMPSSTGVGTVLSDEHLLDALDYPNKDRILQDKANELQAAMEVGQMQAESQGGEEDEQMRGVATALKRRGLTDEYMPDVMDILREAGGGG